MSADLPNVVKNWNSKSWTDGIIRALIFVLYGRCHVLELFVLFVNILFFCGVVVMKKEVKSR